MNSEHTESPAVGSINEGAATMGQAASIGSRPLEETVEILVNRRPVKITRGERTGLEIKEAAIEQHIPIQLDFVLTLHKAGGETKVIGDNDPVRVHNEQRFTAVADDDKS